MALYKNYNISGLNMLNSLTNTLPLLAHGLAATLEIFSYTMLLSLVVALFMDWCKFIAPCSIKKIIDGSAFIIRSVPELVFLFILYFGLLAALKLIFGHYINCSPFIAGVITLTLIYSAFLLPVFDGAKKNIADAQKQAAILLGLSKWQQYCLIIKPQSIKHAMPGCVNLAICLIKDTALLSLIGTSEFMNTIQLNAINNQQPFLFYGIACVVYLLICLLLEKLLLNKAQVANWEY